LSKFFICQRDRLRLSSYNKSHTWCISHNIPDIQIVQWNLTEKNKIEEIIEEELKKAENKSKKGRKISNIEKEIKLQAEVERQTERAKNLDKLYSSKAFAKFLIGLSFLNLSIAFSQLKESPSGKNTVNFSSVAFDFSFACTKLIEIERNLAGKDVKGVKNLNKFFSKMAGLLTATYCIWEGYDAFVENDKDAAAAFVSSGALFAIAAFCGSTGVGVIIGAVAIGVYILANYWRDDEFERYFKNSWLRSDSDVKLYQKALNTPSWSYLHKIYRNRNLLMNSKNKKLVNPWKNNIHLCYQSFLNLFNKSDLKAIGISRNMESFFDDNNSIYCCTGGVDEVNIVAFPEFSDSLKNVDQFDYRIFVQNVVTKSIEEVPKGAISTPILTTENGKWCIKVDICISQWRRYKYGTAMGVKFIIAYKLQLNQEDFPYTYAGDPKYFIVSVPLHLNYREYSSNTCKPSVYYSCEFEAPVKKETVGTINQLINGKLKL